MIISQQAAVYVVTSTTWRIGKAPPTAFTGITTPRALGRIVSINSQYNIRSGRSANNKAVCCVSRCGVQSVVGISNYSALFQMVSPFVRQINPNDNQQKEEETKNWNEKYIKSKTWRLIKDSHPLSSAVFVASRFITDDSGIHSSVTCKKGLIFSIPHVFKVWFSWVSQWTIIELEVRGKDNTPAHFTNNFWKVCNTHAPLFS